jgi:ABC-type multidrug transport system ATPase subunit
LIRITGLTKRYGRTRVLNGLDLSVEPGETVLLVGANGCGKSTTLRVLVGLSAVDAGRVEVRGLDVAAHQAEARAALSFLPQSPRFDERLTTGQILAFYARLRGLPAARVDRVAAMWGLREYLRVPTGKLSGGTRQRLGVAIFDLPEAPILVLDEPGLSLDPGWRATLQAHLRVAAAAGRAVLVATHLLGEWDGQADRCLVLEGGRIGREVSPDGLRTALTLPLPCVALPNAS